MKNIILSFFILSLPLSFSEAKGLPDLSFECKWQKSEDHAKDYYLPNSGFNMVFYTGDSFVIEKDSFFNRSYEPCWMGEWESCKFSFTYNAEKEWKVKRLDEDKYEAHQAWTLQLEEGYGTVSGFSSLTFNFSKDLAHVQIKGDDDSGTFFEENFLCDLYVH